MWAQAGDQTFFSSFNGVQISVVNLGSNLGVIRLFDLVFSGVLDFFFFFFELVVMVFCLWVSFIGLGLRSGGVC